MCAGDRSTAALGAGGPGRPRRRSRVGLLARHAPAAALERALLHEPRLILLDEPFTGLDQASTAALVARLQERQQAGCLIVLATHDLDVADGAPDPRHLS